MTEKDIARFWEKVNKDGPIPPHRPELGKCWVWNGKPRFDGYGQMMMSSRCPMLSHRASWIISCGIPNRCVLHKCDNRVCVNPDHLFLGTRPDNMTDKCKKGRQTRGEENGPSKLTKNQVIEIKKRHAVTREFHKIIAKDYGVSRGLIGNIIRGKNWKHITLG